MRTARTAARPGPRADGAAMLTLGSTVARPRARTPLPRRPLTGTLREPGAPPLAAATTWRRDAAATTRAPPGAARRRPPRSAALISSRAPAPPTLGVRAARTARGSTRPSSSVFLPPARPLRGGARGRHRRDHATRSSPRTRLAWRRSAANAARAKARRPRARAHGPPTRSSFVPASYLCMHRSVGPAFRSVGSLGGAFLAYLGT
ncbi:hypothetical protein I4F81_007549 [Pyropia yezoensis]|uniref:Uncharacterized protein n=1 Tax=Pyropia yezoensis TaxID=2788 RepID=A0ACC3C4J3_PYRYE|nr:hypothetical protein I4F81_007549 [Neopyropia yezoensis]